MTFVYFQVASTCKPLTNHILLHTLGHPLCYLLSFPSTWSFIISKVLFNLSWHNDSRCLVLHGSESCSFRARWGIHNLQKRAKPHLAFACCSFYKWVVRFPFPQSQHCAFVCWSNLQWTKCGRRWWCPSCITEEVHMRILIQWMNVRPQTCDTGRANIYSLHFFFNPKHTSRGGPV